MNIYDLTGNPAVVTGARRGIEHASEIRPAACGAATVVSDLDKERINGQTLVIDGGWISA